MTTPADILGFGHTVFDDAGSRDVVLQSPGTRFAAWRMDR
jgi:hypothetical protein